jgi:hypothetical protein
MDKKDNTYCLLNGGLGNQLFQIANLLDFCEKYSRIPIININFITPNLHQHYNIYKTIYSLQKLFSKIKFESENVNIDFNINEQNGAFKYNEHHNYYKKNILFSGYFISHKYFSEYNSIKTHINIQPHNQNLLNFNFSNTYFIHIRLGDYLYDNRYKLNLTGYYIYCINKIKQLNCNAQFIICTNEYSQNLYNYINSFPKDNYILQDKSNDELDTIYIMSQCAGGICSNSTLSWMGTYFQKNKTKETIFMPHPWLKSDEFSKEIMWDVYPDWATVYDTENNKIIEK